MEEFQNTRQPDWDWWGKLWPTPGATLERLGVTAGTTLAEVGCGNGYFALPAARITDPAPVYALDIDRSLLDELARIADRQRIENVVTVRGDARQLADQLPTPVDLVLLANTLHGVEEKADLVREVYESLRSGGQLVVVNWSDLPRETTTVAGAERGPPNDLRMAPGRTRAVVRDAADFTPTEHVELPPYHYALRFDR